MSVGVMCYIVIDFVDEHIEKVSLNPKTHSTQLKIGQKEIS